MLVTGGGGFIGAHLVTYLKELGYWVRAADIREPEFGSSGADEYSLADLRNSDNCMEAMRDIDQVYALAADMGGIGYISRNHSKILRNNTLINLNTLDAAHTAGIHRYLFTSSACVYPGWRQTTNNPVQLKEDSAFPADPPTAYGWEKLTAEKLLSAYSEDHGLVTRVVRLHNVYGPYGSYDGGCEKVPAALCRKVASVEPGGTIDVWGDGSQIRSFCYIDDCVEGLHRVMLGDHGGPLNLGSEEAITINDLTRLIIEISAKQGISIRNIDGPQGVRSRNSDNSVLRQTLGWAPAVTLFEGLTTTYRWVAGEVEKAARSPRGRDAKQPLHDAWSVPSQRSV